MTLLARYSILLFAFTMLPNSAVAAPPYSGTVFIESNILNEEDPSSFVHIVPNGSGSRQMFDRRVNDWVVLNALLFNAFYTDGEIIEIQVNPEFDAEEAADKALFYGLSIGRLPAVLRRDVETVWIHKGDQPFGGGNNNLLIHTDAAGYHGVWLEETLFHEACHTSLDSQLANSSQWLAAQTADAEFISTYARDNPIREDVAESCLPHYAVRYSSERISAGVKSTIEATMPNRLTVLDGLSIQKVVASDSSAAFDVNSQLVDLPAVQVGDEYYSVTLALTDVTALTFSMTAAQQAAVPGYSSVPEFAANVLSVPLLLAADKRYSLTFDLLSADPVTFRLSSATELD